jgi:hypothetical protein
MFKDLMIENRVTRAQLDKYFNPYEAEKLEIIKVLIETENFISINFRKGTKQVAGPGQARLMGRTSKVIALGEGKKEETKEVNLQQLEPDNTVKLPAIKNGLREIPQNYTPSQDLIRACIGDYEKFFKQLQVDKSALVGRAITIEQAARPKIGSEDAKHIKELCKHFATLDGVGNEEQIRRCFHRIYGKWWDLSDFITRFPALRYIHKNIDQIIIEIQQLNNNNGKTTDKRENELNSKINRARQKDYSHLAKSRKKDD